MPCSLADMYQCFRETFCLCLQSAKGRGSHSCEILVSLYQAERHDIPEDIYYIVFVIEPQRDHINIVICDHHYSVCHKPEWTVKSAKGKQTRKAVDQSWAKIARGWSSCFFFQYFIKYEKCVFFYEIYELLIWGLDFNGLVF
jgi:hypothetical protein